MKKYKKLNIGKLFTIITSLVVICLSLSMADLFSSLITVGGFTFTSNDISLPKYNVYAISLSSTETAALAQQQSETIKNQGGAGYIYLDNSKYYIITSIYENESDAIKVKDALKSSNKPAEIITISILPITISSNLLGEEKAVLEESLNIFKKTYIQLYDISVSLDTAVINEVAAKLSINELGSEINKILTNFSTVFDNETSNNFLIIKLKLNELFKYLNDLISINANYPITSQIKETYCKVLILYKSLSSTLN